MRKELENCSLLELAEYVYQYDDVKNDVPFELTVYHEMIKDQAKNFLLLSAIHLVSNAVYKRIAFDLGIE